MEGVREAPPDALLDGLRYQHAAWVGQRLQACGDIDVIAKYVVWFDDDVTQGDTDAEREPALSRLSLVFLPDRVLKGRGAPHGFDGARELGDEAVTCILDDPAAVIRNRRLDRA